MREELKKDINYFYLIISVLLWIVSIGWMTIIFILSSDPATVSTEKSTLAVDLVLYFFKLSIPEVVMRKCFHVFEFAFLAFTCYFSAYTTNFISDRFMFDIVGSYTVKSINEVAILVSLWLSVLWAALDEYHQLFVQGRSGSFYDLILDVAGIVVTLALIRIASVIREKKSNNR